MFEVPKMIGFLHGLAPRTEEQMAEDRVRLAKFMVEVAWKLDYEKKKKAGKEQRFMAPNLLTQGGAARTREEAIAFLEAHPNVEKKKGQKMYRYKESR